MCRRFSERYRYASAFFLLVSLAHQVSSTTTTTCPYDIDYSTSIIPPACYANATSSSAFATNCCWLVFASYLYAAIRYSNLTGTAFPPNATVSACSSSFSSALLHRGLVSPSLLLSADRCNLSGNPVQFAAGMRPCQFATVSAVRSSVDLSDAVRLCTTGRRLLTDDQPACVTCQDAVTAATFALFDATQSKEIVACGMAATIGIWSSSMPDIWRFRSYALCMVQILENVGGLGTSNLIPSPPPAIVTVRGSHRPSARTAKLAAAGAGAVFLAAVLLCLAFGIPKWRRKSIAVITTDQDLTVVIRSPLPTEGLYIFTKNELKLATNCYDQSLLLGEGGAGRVYLGKLPSGQHVAIKRIQKKKKLGEFYREVEILAKLRHRNLATLVGYCVQAREHVLVYEYMAGGNLSRALHHGELTWHQRVRIAVDVAEGLAYLHEFPDGTVVHRDVKPTNVLLSEAGQAKLSDFGVSKIVPSGISHVSTEIKGTMGYVDPECFSAGHVSETADVYSFGVVLLELVTGMRAVLPTPSGGAESLVQAVHGVMTSGAGEDPEMERVVDERLAGEWDRGSAVEVFRLAYRCVKPYKNERPVMKEVLSVLKRVLADMDACRVSGPGDGPDGGGDDDVARGRRGSH